MILFLVRSTISFAISFLILSIPLDEATIFDKLTVKMAPYTQRIFSYADRYLPAKETTKEVVKKILTSKPPIIPKTKIESLPSVVTLRDEKEIRDSVSETNASGALQDTPSESYTPEERELLLKVMTDSNH